MKKNILIINSGKEIEYLFDFFNELILGGDNFFFMEANIRNLQKLEENNWPYKKIKKREKVSFLRYLFFWPFDFFYWFIVLLYFKKKKFIEHVVLFSVYEKLVVSLPARLLKIKVIWGEFPSRDINHLNKFILKLLINFSHKVKLITFTEFYKKRLEGMNFKNVLNIGLGINLSNYSDQNNIFESIAKSEHEKNNKKFFTVGTALVMDDLEKTEIMFQAVKKCLAVIPHLQFIVVGDGEKRKNFLWLAKRMEIDNLSWFVGKKEYLKKWFDSFDVFCHPQDDLTLDNLTVVIQALASRLPVIGPDNIGLEDVLESKDQVITVEPEKAEVLAQEIIRVYKNRYLYKRMTKNNDICNIFSTEKMANNFKEIL